MKALVVCGQLRIEVEGETQYELLGEIGRAQEVFSDVQCGLCQSKNLRYRIRSLDKDGEEFDFPELTCRDCHAKLSFGQEKRGGRLFPIRKLNAAGLPDRKTGSYGPHNGWHKLKQKEDDSGEPQERPERAVDKQGDQEDRPGRGGRQGGVRRSR